tara:strand:- start:5621 stop:8422 length:2802 start_codon:yes stop_codon:yes gene_type:complete
MAYRYPGGKRISRPRSKNEFGCARQYQTDPNQVYFGWTATNYLASNPGCDNGSGVALITNTSCCNWDTVVGLPKLGPGTQKPLAPADYPLGKTRFGCAQEYQGDSNLPYFGWYAYNYDPLADGCDGGNGQPNSNNTDCCMWDILVGGKVGPQNDKPLAPNDYPLGKTRYGCAQIEQTDPSLPFFGWTAYNYDPLADGCDNGSGNPVYSNTDCCDWDLITGGGKVGPGYTTKKEIREPSRPFTNSLKKPGCAQETCNDINSPDYGCYHKPFYGLTAFPYNNPLFYHVTNDGCPNAFGFPQVNNIDCCECDTPVGTGATGDLGNAKLGPSFYPIAGLTSSGKSGYDAPLQSDTKPIKWAYGCAQEYQSNPNLPYYGWYAMNYSQSYPGCDVGTGFPDPNNTDCCSWDILLGSPRVSDDGTKVAPRGFHFMPDGSLMSNADMYEREIFIASFNKETKELLIYGLTIDTSDIPSSGARRSFVVSGDIDASFNIEVRDADGNHYDFYTETWVARTSMSATKRIGSDSYTGYINFSGVATKLHTFTVRLFTKDVGSKNTKLKLGSEVRNNDGSLNVNLSGAQNQRMVEKIIFQNVTTQLSLSCVSPSLSGSGGVWQNLKPRPSDLTGASVLSINETTAKGAMPFKITVQAGDGRSISINRQPSIDDLVMIHVVTVGDSALPIKSEPINAESPRFYRWPISNVAGLSHGMILDPLGSNVTANSEIKNYSTQGQYDIEKLSEYESQELIRETVKYKEEFIKAVTPTGPILAVNQAGFVTSQAGEVVFNQQQVDAFKGDSGVAIYGYGEESVQSLSYGFLTRFSDIKAEILEEHQTVTTVTSDSAKVKSTAVTVSEMDGITAGVSFMTGEGVGGKVLVIAKSSASGSGVLTLQEPRAIQQGATVRFSGSAKNITITGFVKANGDLSSSKVIYLDVERFLTSV